MAESDADAVGLLDDAASSNDVGGPAGDYSSIDKDSDSERADDNDGGWMKEGLKEKLSARVFFVSVTWFCQFMVPSGARRGSGRRGGGRCTAW